ncbi:MAG: hypothetical protein EXR77_19580 [Myxococcales bacterium]|nr:hypothetical protein [Myxococcales bacterium]
MSRLPTLCIGLLMAVGCESGGVAGTATAPLTAPDSALASDTAATDGATATADAGQSGQTVESDAGSAVDAGGTDGPATALDAISDTGTSATYPKDLKLGLMPWTMQPKAETTRCLLKRLDNVDTVWVHQIVTKMAKGSHHLIVYRSDATEEQLTTKECTPFTETLSGGNVPLMITQIANETLTLPKGVAFKFLPKQMIRLEAHYLNYFKEPIETGADITFETLPPAQVENEADMLFYGTPDFAIKAGKSLTTPWNYIDVWPGTKVFAATGHTHQYGTDVQIGLAKGGTSVAAEMVYPPKDQPFNWAESPMAQYNPPLEFKANEGFQYRCSWFNSSAKNVGFGESANQEMCFFWAYYYPSKGYRMCINPGKWKDQAPDLITDPVCCPDSPLCGLIKNYISKGGFGGG